MVSTGEKYALEIEFFALSRGFRAQISRSCAQKSIFRSQCAGSLENRLFQHNRPIAACSNGQLATKAGSGDRKKSARSSRWLLAT
jgi:hypothetical protein